MANLFMSYEVEEKSVPDTLCSIASQLGLPTQFGLRMQAVLKEQNHTRLLKQAVSLCRKYGVSSTSVQCFIREAQRQLGDRL